MLKRPSTEFIGVVVLATAVGCGAAAGARPVQGGPVATGPESITSARKFLQGRWGLEQFEVFPPGKPAITLKGSGTLAYDDFGNLKIEIRADEQSCVPPLLNPNS
jgi:hypothetical protein